MFHVLASLLSVYFDNTNDVKCYYTQTSSISTHWLRRIPFKNAENSYAFTIGLIPL
jgi:hypothetical protein